MKIAIVHRFNRESTARLKEHFDLNKIQADVFNLSKTDRRDFRDYDYVFAYGTSCRLNVQKRINTSQATSTCVSKVATFDFLVQAGVPTVQYATSAKQAADKGWATTVCRKEMEGRRGEGLEYAYSKQELLEKYRDYELFTEYFEHKYEYRIVVFMGKVVGRYYKADAGGDQWDFKLLPKRGFEVMDEACIKAAKQIGIDYVGFDVVANTKKDFAILEANSGPILTDEAGTAIVEYFLNLK